MTIWGTEAWKCLKLPGMWPWLACWHFILAHEIAGHHLCTPLMKSIFTAAVSTGVTFGGTSTIVPETNPALSNVCQHYHYTGREGWKVYVWWSIFIKWKQYSSRWVFHICCPQAHLLALTVCGRWQGNIHSRFAIFNPAPVIKWESFDQTSGKRCTALWFYCLAMCPLHPLTSTVSDKERASVCCYSHLIMMTK